MTRKIIAAAGLALGLAGFASAGDENPITLSIGDPAPSIDIAHWLKGVEFDRKAGFTPMTEFEDGKVYVLEFWATWCGPCKASMPHLSKLQEKYKDYDVTVIGVSDEPLPTVVNFLFDTWAQDGKIQHDRTQYVLCTDPDESVKKDYFLAAGRAGIPSAFIIGKDRRIEWIGHPMDMDDALDAVVFDTWDRDAFRTSYEVKAQAEAKMRAAYKNKDWDTVLEAIDAQLAADPDDLGAMMQKFNVLLIHKQDADAAYAHGRAVVKKAWDDAGLLNAIAWTIADDQRIQRRDLDLAMTAASRANELTDSKDAAILDTLARVHYEQGDIDKAIKWQKKAVEYAGDDQLGAGIREALEKYESAKK